VGLGGPLSLSQPAHIFETVVRPILRAHGTYKFIALEIDLVPVSGHRLVPDLRLIVGGSLLALFLAVNWLRAARHRANFRTCGTSEGLGQWSRASWEGTTKVMSKPRN
jgi:hypothetical protein